MATRRLLAVCIDLGATFHRMPDGGLGYSCPGKTKLRLHRLLATFSDWHDDFADAFVAAARRTVCETASNKGGGDAA